MMLNDTFFQNLYTIEVNGVFFLNFFAVMLYGALIPVAMILFGAFFLNFVMIFNGALFLDPLPAMLDGVSSPPAQAKAGAGDKLIIS